MVKQIFLIRHSIKEKVNVEIDNINRQELDRQKRLSFEGKTLAFKLSQNEILKDIEEIWASSYERAIETAKYLCKNDIKLNISDSFDERHYGDFDAKTKKEEFWINQFKDENLKNINGESQKDVRDRFDKKINYLLNNSSSNKIAVVTHNAGTLFYILKYCKLINAEVPKKLTIKYKNKILIKDGIMKSPSIMKLEFENRNLINIDYIEI